MHLFVQRMAGEDCRRDFHRLPLLGNSNAIEQHLNTNNGLSGREDIPMLTSSDFRQVNLTKDDLVGR